MSRPVLGSAARSTHATHTARQHPPTTPNSSRESPLSAQQATSLAPVPRASATRLSPGRNTVSLPRQTHTTRAVCCAPGALIQGCTGKRICATSDARSPVPQQPPSLSTHLAPLPPRKPRRARPPASSPSLSFPQTPCATLLCSSSFAAPSQPSSASPLPVLLLPGSGICAAEPHPLSLLRILMNRH